MKLLDWRRRRRSATAPRLTIRRHVPWPLRIASIAVAVAVGAVGAIWLYQLLFGNAAAERDRMLSEIADLRTRHDEAQAERERLSALANAADSKIKVEQSAAEGLTRQIRALELENGRLKADLAYLETLLPASGSGGSGVTVRRFVVQQESGQTVRYRAMLSLDGRTEREFRGSIQFQVSGSATGRPLTWLWPDESTVPGARDRAKLTFKRYQRLEGSFDLPPGVTMRSAQIRVLENGIVRAQQVAGM